MPTNEYDPKHHVRHEPGPQDPDHPGYEVTDVNVNGIVVFLSGLVGSLLVFFLVCFLLGRAINGQIQRADGPPDRWHQVAGGKIEGLATNPELQQRELNRISKTFPEPRLDIDDGNQATADLHAREDLLLNFYSRTANEQGIRIPVEHAMELIAQRGLPVYTPTTTAPLMVGDSVPTVQAPLTTGFARTGYEQEQIEAREQKMNFNRAESAEAAQK